jgi:subtilisin family serine protease
LPVDVYGNGSSTTTFDVAKGIYAAINAGAMIINLSLGSEGDSQFLHKMIQSGHEQGVLFFAAAGNEPVTTPTYPAAYPEVVAVTAGDKKGNVASYANHGDFVDVIAPGSSIVAFKNRVFLVMGTSASTAYSSGMAAGLADATKKPLSQVESTIRGTLGVKP